MSVHPIVLRPDQHMPALNEVGTQVAVLASNAATHWLSGSCAGWFKHRKSHHGHEPRLPLSSATFG
jgi:hypothetical protein